MNAVFSESSEYLYFNKTRRAIVSQGSWFRVNELQTTSKARIAIEKVEVTEGTALIKTALGFYPCRCRHMTWFFF